MSRNPFLFIVGCPRSGTTLLRRMVDAHPQIAMTRETHWIPDYFKERIGLTPEGLVTDALISALLAHKKFTTLKLGRADLEKLLAGGEPVTYAEFVSGIFDLYGERQHKPLVGDKTPGYVRELPLLHELWPGARLVHLIRDGRDVCLSMQQWSKAPRTAGRACTWDEDPISTIALWWERFVRLGREDAARIGPERCHEIRYEALVEHPVDTCAALCAFLGVPPDPAMARFHEGHTRTRPGRSAKGAWLGPTPGMRDWRAQMPPADVERFEAASGDLLEDLGYDRALPNPRPRALAHAASIRARFAADPRVRRHRLPQHWQARGELVIDPAPGR